MQEDWMRTFAKLGALWQHDGNAKRPYALLTSGKISDFFFNCSKVIEQPHILERAAIDLISLGREETESLLPGAVVGPSHGAVTLAYAIARRLPPARSWFTEMHEGKTALKRFDAATMTEQVLVVEDVITTGRSTLHTIDACMRQNTKMRIYSFVLCLVNRSGRHTLPDGRRIRALVTVDAKNWDRGKNPFSPEGEELVEPVRPKQGWHALEQKY